LKACLENSSLTFKRSQRSLCDDTTLDRKTLRTAIKRAEERGWITVTKDRDGETCGKGRLDDGIVAIERAAITTKLHKTNKYNVDIRKVFKDLFHNLTPEAHAFLGLGGYEHPADMVRALREQYSRDEIALGKISPIAFSSFNPLYEVLEIP